MLIQSDTSRVWSPRNPSGIILMWLKEKEGKVSANAGQNLPSNLGILWGSPDLTFKVWRLWILASLVMKRPFIIPWLNTVYGSLPWKVITKKSCLLFSVILYCIWHLLAYRALCSLKKVRGHDLKIKWFLFDVLTPLETGKVDYWFFYFIKNIFNYYFKGKKCRVKDAHVYPFPDGLSFFRNYS